MASNSIQIGQYTVLQTIGEGSFGKVKLGVHSVTGHKVALKIINRKKIANLDMSSRVKREIQYLKLLRHPHIIKLYEVITTPTDIIMVIEYAGKELFDFIVNNGKMNETSARRFFQQIICAVEYTHRHKIVHRDLKPENLLLDQDDNVKIGDFGLSNIMSDGDFLKTSCGSPNYAAPEVIGGKLYAGPEVDVWSCGVILYVMLCGRLPFDDEYIPNLFKKISEGIFSIPLFLSIDATHLLKSMLIVDPLQRITINDIRQHPWFVKDLPSYLNPLPELIIETNPTPDPIIIDILTIKMNLSKDYIERGLKDIDNLDFHNIRVAYQLVVDHKSMLNDQLLNVPNQLKTYLTGSSPPQIQSQHIVSNNLDSDSDSDNELNQLNFKSEADLEDSNTIRILGTSLPKNNLKIESIKLNRSNTLPSQFNNNNNNLLIKKRVRTKWHFGIRSKNQPLDVMLEIYRGLKQLHMDWKPYGPFHVRCRYHYPNGKMVKIELQLYRLDTASSYLVDFKAVPGTDLYPFFDVCAKLITELAVSS